MYNPSFIVALISVSGALCLVSIPIAIVRKEQALRIYAVACASLAATFVLLLGQGRIPVFFSIFLPNCLIFCFHLLMVIAVRLILNSHIWWPRRFYVYTCSFLTTITIFTWLIPSYPLRAIMVSISLIICAIEIMIPLFQGTAGMPRIITSTFNAFLGLFCTTHMIRIGLLVFNLFVPAFFADATSISTFSFFITIFFSVFWAGMLLMMDGFKTMSKMTRMNDLLQNLSLKDELTGAYNRHYLDQSISAEMDRQDRYRGPLSMIMLNLDHFNRINDTLGQTAGATVLAEAAHRLRHTIRETDLLFRFDEEEFLVVAPHTESQGAGILAEKLRQAISLHPYSGAGTITASFGVAERRTGENLCDWIKRSEMALYQAKDEGGNQVVISDHTSQAGTLFKIEWKRDWESGNQEIDTEHRTILKIGNNLLDMSVSGAPVARIEEELNNLMAYIEEHFEHEETLLRQCGWSNREEHSKIHRSLLADAEMLKGKFYRGELDAGAFFNFLVGKVLVEHLLLDDARFFSYLKHNNK